MLKNRVLRKLFGLKREETTGALGEMHNDWYCSAIIIWVATWRMRWVGHVARTEQKEYRDLVGKPEGKRELGRPGSDQRIIVNWTSKKYDGRVWGELMCHSIGTRGGLLLMW